MSGHTCHWPGCSTEVDPRLWGCRPHWFRLPIAMRNRIWASYRSGQEISKDPSEEYIAAASDVQRWIRENCAAEIGVPMVRTLSIRQPWAWLIVNGHKDIENRDWSTKYRGRFLVHAGKKWGPEEREDVGEIRKEFPEIPLPQTFDLGGIVGSAEIVDCVKGHPSRWFFGPNGLLLSNGTPLPFRPYAGQLGFFQSPDVKA